MNNNSFYSLLALACTVVCPAASAQTSDNPLYLAGPKIPVEQRVDSLIASMTSFTYSNAHADRKDVSALQPVTLSVDVTNRGAVAGDEVAQLYLSRPGIAGAPLRALRGFSRVHLERGERKTLQFVLRDLDLDVVNADGQHRIVAGQVRIWIGGGQPVTRPGLARSAGAQTHFTITDSAALPD